MYTQKERLHSEADEMRRKKTPLEWLRKNRHKEKAKRV